MRLWYRHGFNIFWTLQNKWLLLGTSLILSNVQKSDGLISTQWQKRLEKMQASTALLPNEDVWHEVRLRDRRAQSHKKERETIKRWHWSMETKSFTYTYDCRVGAINCQRALSTWGVFENLSLKQILQPGPKFNWLSLTWVLPSHTHGKKRSGGGDRVPSSSYPR